MFENIYIVLKNKDEKLSEELSKYVKGVKIDVFLDSEGIMCSKKMADVKTILGPTSITDLNDTLERISNGVSYIPNVLSAISYNFSSIWFLVMLIYHFFRPQRNSQFNLNDDRKSFTVVGIDYIPIFINKKIISMLSHDELISVCLSSVFDHTQYTRDTFRKAFINSRWITPLLIVKNFAFGLLGGKLLDKGNDITGNQFGSFFNNLKYGMWVSIILSSAFGIVIMNILNKILYDYNDIKSDNFVVMIGREDSLVSAYKKMKDECDKYETTLSKLAKSAQKLIGLHLNDTPYENRIKNIELNTPNKISDKLMNVDKKFVDIVNSAEI